MEGVKPRTTDYSLTKSTRIGAGGVGVQGSLALVPGFLVCYSLISKKRGFLGKAGVIILLLAGITGVAITIANPILSHKVLDSPNGVGWESGLKRV